MEKINRTIDDVFAMSDSRYSLVNAISRKAREIADEAEENKEVLPRKPVNMVIDRLLDGRATIERMAEPTEEDLFADDEPTSDVWESVDAVPAEEAAEMFDDSFDEFV